MTMRSSLVIPPVRSRFMVIVDMSILPLIARCFFVSPSTLQNRYTGPRPASYSAGTLMSLPQSS